MSLTMTERLHERVGPIVVKEVRQGLRAKVFAIFFSVLLVACLAAALVAVAETETGSEHLGRGFLAAYLVALATVCCFVIPFTAFRSTLREQEEETWVLLLLTGLGGRNIVRGKWVSAMAQALLFASACAPFVVFTYFLNGIDIPQIVIALALMGAWSCFLTSLAIGIATQAHSRLARTFAHFVALIVLGAGSFGAFAFSVAFAEDGSRLITDDGFLTFCAGLFLASLAVTVLVLEGAAAGLALPTEVASKGPRKALAVVVVASLACGFTGFSLNHVGSQAAGVGSVIVSLFLVVCGVFAISERDGYPERFAGMRWFKPGAKRSYWLIIWLLALSTGVWFTFYATSVMGASSRTLRTVLGAPLYPALYLSIAAVLGRVTALRKLGEPVATRAAFALSVAVGSVAPPVISVVAGGRGNDRLANALNPLVGMLNFIDSSSSSLDSALVFLAAATLLAVFFAGVTLAAADGARSP